jgi:hypothetical protein
MQCPMCASKPTRTFFLSKHAVLHRLFRSDYAEARSGPESGEQDPSLP